MIGPWVLHIITYYGINALEMGCQLAWEMLSVYVHNDINVPSDNEKVHLRILRLSPSLSLSVSWVPALLISLCGCVDNSQCLGADGNKSSSRGNQGCLRSVMEFILLLLLLKKGHDWC